MPEVFTSKRRGKSWGDNFNKSCSILGIRSLALGSRTFRLFYSLPVSIYIAVRMFPAKADTNSPISTTAILTSYYLL